jgi:branched-chain amino acid transport system ATP-binding protein
MLLVDHDMGLVLGICDEVVVLEFGEVIARGAPDLVRNDPQVIGAYLGGAALQARCRRGLPWLTRCSRSRR